MISTYRFKQLVLVALISGSTFACKSFLDVTPDGIGTIEYAFRMRNEAEKYLFTCYNNLPNFGSVGSDPGFYAGDEFTAPYPSTHYFDIGLNRIARGEQNKVNPLANYWDGGNGGKAYFQAIRECNIFLENINSVPDIQEFERKRWIAEVKFLKAYYHFYLMRMYGPIPITKESLPVSASIDEVRVKRNSIDEVTSYIVELLDEANTDLPDRIMNEASELGRATQVMAKSLKAITLVTAASPLFNGNTEYSNFTDKDGKALFGTYDANKWTVAANACKEAIDAAHTVGSTLYYYTPISGEQMSDTTRTTMNIRASITDKWNPEIIWGATNSMAADVQALAQARLTSGDPGAIPHPPATNESIRSMLAPPIHIAEMFYSSNGIPIDEDRTYQYSERFSRLRKATEDYRYYIKNEYETVQLNYDREPRFYASMGFDGGIWYGNGLFNDNKTWFLEGKSGQRGGRLGASLYSVTGYWAKKLVNYKSDFGASSNGFTSIAYPWPVIKLSELYLLYAEALNETQGPGAETYEYIDKVRKRAGLEGVVDSWNKFSRSANKPTTKEGLRDIIQRETLIETVFEGKRYWNLQRWKTADIYLNFPIRGWDLEQEVGSNYYRVKQLYVPAFTFKHYLWPIAENSIIVNPNLVQNPGW